jgi:hypothetical protein
MTDTNYASKIPSRLLDVKMQMDRIPLIRRNSFVYSFLALLVAYGFAAPFRERSCRARLSFDWCVSDPVVSPGQLSSLPMN